VPWEHPNAGGTATAMDSPWSTVRHTARRQPERTARWVRAAEWKGGVISHLSEYIQTEA